MSKKTSHEGIETKDVDLGEVYTRTELFLENNRKPITIAAVSLVAVVALLLGYRKFIAEPRAAKASEEMWKAEYWFEVDSMDLALQGNNEWPGFTTIADEYSGTPAASLAHMHMGAIYMQKGEYETAIEHYKNADPDEEMLEVLAVGAIGDAYVELGRPEDGLKQFEKAATMLKNDMTTPLYLMKAGILHQQAGNWKAAAAAFKRIATEFPNSNEASQARKYAGRAEAMGG